MNNCFQLRQFLLTILVVWLSLSDLVAQNYFPIKEGQKWGLMDDKGKVFLQPLYDAISEFDKFGYAVIQKGSKIGLINRKAIVVLTPQYDQINVLNASLFAVNTSGTWKVMNTKNETVLNHQYDKIELLSGDQFLTFKQKDKWGLVHISGRIISEALYDRISTLSDGFFQTQNGKKLGLVHENGQLILTPQASKIKIHDGQFALFRLGKKWGGVNNAGKILVTPDWDFHLVLTNTFVKFKKDNKAALFDIPSERMISEGEYDDFYKYTKSTILVKKDVKVGLMDATGRLLLNTKYDEILDFGENQYRVRNKKLWGAVKIDDVALIPQEYSYITPLNNSVCAVRKGKLFGIANFKGNVEIDLEYDRIEIQNNSAKAYKGKSLKTLFFNAEGQLEEENDYKIKGSIKIGKKSRRRLNGMINRSDFRMENFEWFYSPLEDKWGLRNTKTGTEQIPPTYHRIAVHRNLGFTIVGLEKRTEQDFERTGFRFEYVFGIVNNKRGLLVSEVNMLDIRVSDFNEKKLPTARVIFAGGRHGLMEKNGRIVHKDYAYIGEFENGLARMSPKGYLTASFKNKLNGLGELKGYLKKIDSPNDMADYTYYDRQFFKEAVVKCKDCIWGYMDTMGKIKIQPTYSFARPFKERIAIVKNSDKWGVISTDNQVLLNTAYNDIQFLANTDDSMLRIYVNHAQYGLIDKNGKTIIPVEYQSVGKVSEGLVAVKKNEKWGFCNLQGIEVIPCQYKAIQPFSEGHAAVKKGRKWGLIDANGATVFPIQYKAIGNVKEGLVWVKSKRLYNFKTIEHQLAFEGNFDGAEDFQEGLARIKIGKHFGLIDKDGQVILKPKDYISIEPYDTHGLAIARMDNKKKSYVLINKLGEKITTKKFQEIYQFHEGLAAVKYRNHYGFIDVNGNIMIEPDFDDVGQFSEGRAKVRKNNKWGFINTNGTIVIKPIYSKAQAFQNGLAVVYQGNQKTGLIDSIGKVVVPTVVNRILAYSNKKGLVRDKDYKYYFINADNKLFKGYYQKAMPFHEGVAPIKRSGKWGLINQKGIEIIPPKYAQIGLFEAGYAPVRINRFSGVSNLHGKIIVDTSYEYISYAGEGIFRVERGDKLGYFNSNGNWVWDLE